MYTDAAALIALQCVEQRAPRAGDLSRQHIRSKWGLLPQQAKRIILLHALSAFEEVRTRAAPHDALIGAAAPPQRREVFFKRLAELCEQHVNYHIDDATFIKEAQRLYASLCH